jgi:hypothetical protein
MIRMLSGPPARDTRAPRLPGSQAGRLHPGVLEIDCGWLGGYGLGSFLQDLTGEIRAVLGREPDTADLLLVLAYAPETRAARAFTELGVDSVALASVIERLRDAPALTAADSNRRGPPTQRTGDRITTVRHRAPATRPRAPARPRGKTQSSSHTPGDPRAVRSTRPR